MTSVADTPITAPSLRWQYLFIVSAMSTVLAVFTHLSMIQATIFSSIAFLDILGKKPASIRFIPDFLIIKLICAYVVTVRILFLEIMPLLGYDAISMFHYWYELDIYKLFYVPALIVDTQYYFTAWMLSVALYGLIFWMKKYRIININRPAHSFWIFYYVLGSVLTWQVGAYWESNSGIILKLAGFLVGAAAFFSKKDNSDNRIGHPATAI